MTEEIRCIRPKTNAEIVERLDMWIAALRRARRRQELHPTQYHFDMGDWVKDYSDSDDSDSTPRGYPKGFCGVAACAAGTAALDEDCRALGLDYEVGEVFLITEDGERLIDDTALAEFCGITNKEADLICWPSRYEDRTSTEIGINPVIDRIKAIKLKYVQLVEDERDAALLASESH